MRRDRRRHRSRYSRCRGNRGIAWRPDSPCTMKPYKPAPAYEYLTVISLVCSVMMATLMTPDEIKTLLKLEPHPVEGGVYRRTYTAAGTLELPRGVRAQSTAIYYLLEPGTFSEMHVLDSYEI